MVKKINIKDLSIMAVLSTILIVQEEILSFLPNISLTIFLIILYSKKLKTIKTSIIVLVHVILDSIIVGTFNPVFLIFSYIGYVFIPISLNTFFKRINSNLGLALISIIFSLFYSYIYLIPNLVLYNIDIISYLIADIIFEILLIVSSFITTLWLYDPLSKVLERFL